MINLREEEKTHYTLQNISDIDSKGKRELQKQIFICSALKLYNMNIVYSFCLLMKSVLCFSAQSITLGDVWEEFHKCQPQIHCMSSISHS